MSARICDFDARLADAFEGKTAELRRLLREFGPMGASEQHPIVLDSSKKYSKDQKWVYELELECDEYLAGGFGDLENAPELRKVFNEVEGIYTNVESDEEIKISEELMRRYVEQRLGGSGKVVWE